MTTEERATVLVLTLREMLWPHLLGIVELEKHYINLLPRFYDPQDGFIEIDGQNIKDVSLSSLRKNLSLVSQDVILLMILLKIIFIRQTQCI